MLVRSMFRHESGIGDPRIPECQLVANMQTVRITGVSVGSAIPIGLRAVGSLDRRPIKVEPTDLTTDK